MILNINKPKDWTSADVVKKLKGMLKVKKIGHAGTLDPLATGVLIVLTDSDTKKQSEIMGLEKEYVAEIAFGVTSASFDMEQPLEEVVGKENATEQAILELLPKFVGKYEQEIPVYSAKKVDGSPLYKKAHKGFGADLEVQKKEVEVHNIELLEFSQQEINRKNFPLAKIKVSCAKGFFVRSFANDLGKALKTGAVLFNLTRTKVGGYTVEDSKGLNEYSSLSTLTA